MLLTTTIIAALMAQLGASSPHVEARAASSYQFFQGPDCSGSPAGSGSFSDPAICATAGEAVQSVQLSVDDCYSVRWSSESTCNANIFLQPWFFEGSVQDSGCAAVPQGQSGFPSEALSAVFGPCGFN